MTVDVMFVEHYLNAANGPHFKNTTEPNSFIQMRDVPSVKLFHSQNPVIDLSLFQQLNISSVSTGIYLL